jgi:hypothetical protein
LPNVGSNAIVSYSFEDQVDEEKRDNKADGLPRLYTPYKIEWLKRTTKKCSCKRI